MILISPELEALARGLASRQGISTEEAIKTAIERYAREAGLPVAPQAKRDPATIVAGIEVIAKRSTGRPIYDTRSADEIIGYDEHGVPR